MEGDWPRWQVFFAWPLSLDWDPESAVLELYLNHIKDRVAFIDFRGIRYTCTVSDWLGYLRALLKSRKSGLLSTWRVPVGDREQRFHAAATLALIAPETEDLVEYFLDILNRKDYPDYRAILFLGEIGTMAFPAIESLQALVADSRIECKEVHSYVMDALKKIQGISQ